MKKQLLLAMLCLSLAACGGKQTGVDEASPQASYMLWQELSQRLQKDGLNEEKTRALFARLDTPPSLRPMGTKITELYSSRFLAKPASKAKARPKPQAQKPKAKASAIPGPWYKGVVLRENANKCREFIRSNFKTFRIAEERYGVPREVGAALLFVETRLGEFMGSQNAFYSLASMSVKRSPEQMVRYLGRLPGAWDRFDWIESRMEEKSEWAYSELKALLEYSYANRLDPMQMPGSIYGAIGLCQFMPSNIARFGADGNGDGIVDLFTAPDAILSLSRYLSENGWRRGMNLKGQVKALKRYNQSTSYAHTILALAELIEKLEHPGTVNRSVPSPKKNAVKKSARKKAPAAQKAAKPKSRRYVSAKGRDVTRYVD